MLLLFVLYSLLSLDHSYVKFFKFVFIFFTAKPEPRASFSTGGVVAGVLIPIIIIAILLLVVIAVLVTV